MKRIWKIYSVAYDAMDTHSREIPLTPAGRQAFVFDEKEGKWFLAESDGNKWIVYEESSEE